MLLPLDQLVVVSFCGLVLAWKIIPKFREKFLKAGIYGIDMNKDHRRTPEPWKVPEATGVITGCVFLMVTFIMIPLVFRGHLMTSSDARDFPHDEFVQLVSALLSISCMLLLGFADDVLDLKWRHKLLLPSLASLPLLVVYYVTVNRTEVVVPLFLQPALGLTLDLGIFYYIYMGMLAVFCTNAINILAGINGLEVGQSLIIALSIMIFNWMEMEGQFGSYHRFSLYFLCPYVATSSPLLYYNWYPAVVFSGDTFCYFSGMTFAVVAILGHFSKTLLLFFMPQVANFLYSVPQLFRLVPCPRHRLPKYDPDKDTVSMSFSVFKQSHLSPLGRLALNALNFLGLVHLKRYSKDAESFVECNNLTLINFVLKFIGPTRENSLTVILLLFQAFCSCLGFAVRYKLAGIFYDNVTA